MYFLAKMEVQDGESEENECELAITDIDQLVNNFVEKYLEHEKENS